MRNRFKFYTSPQSGKNVKDIEYVKTILDTLKGDMLSEEEERSLRQSLILLNKKSNLNIRVNKEYIQLIQQITHLLGENENSPPMEMAILSFR